jgi:hypothetical protein
LVIYENYHPVHPSTFKVGLVWLVIDHDVNKERKKEMGKKIERITSIYASDII